MINLNIFALLTPKEDTLHLRPDCTIRQALEKLDHHKLTVVPLVTEQGDFFGTVSVSDLLRYIKNDCNFNMLDAEEVRVCDVPKYKPYTAISFDAGPDEIIRMTLNQNFIPVQDDRGKYIGIVKRKDVLRYIIKNMEEA